MLIRDTLQMLTRTALSGYPRHFANVDKDCFEWLSDTLQMLTTTALSGYPRHFANVDKDCFGWLSETLWKC